MAVTKEKLSYFINGNGEITEAEFEEPIDNSQSLVLGLVDDLGTSAKIYLYGNPEKITTGTITVTMPEGITVDETSANSIKINAIADNTEITGNASTTSTAGNYTVCTVKKNGVYTFSATDGTNISETKIRVKNIETFKAVESLRLEWATLKGGTKAYNYKGASVPVGYYVDTKTDVNTGLVVTDEIDSEGYSTGNEWVWVPVNSTVENNDFYRAGTGNFAGATSVSYDKYSKLYSFTTTNGVTTRTALSVMKPSGTSGYREPSLLSNSSYDERKYYSSINKRGTTTPFTAGEGVTAVATQYKTDYDDMITSVENYGGFYIGRYEITESGEKAGASLTNRNWYYLYNECMKLGKKDTNDNIITESGMIYGTLWDATMQWLAQSDISVGKTGNTTSGYGNYNTEAVTVKNSKTTIIVKPSGTLKKLKTGQTSYTKSNNIYDLSGNCYDWTQEASPNNSRVMRGGDCCESYSDLTCSAGRAYGKPSSDDRDYTSRPHFYIK